MRTAAKRDSNEPETIRALEALGATVVRLSAPGLPDLLVAYRGKIHLFEVKSKDGKLTPNQVDFHRSWPIKIEILRSAEDAIRVTACRISSYASADEHMSPSQYREALLRERAK